MIEPTNTHVIYMEPAEKSYENFSYQPECVLLDYCASIFVVKWARVQRDNAST